MDFLTNQQQWRTILSRIYLLLALNPVRLECILFLLWYHYFKNKLDLLQYNIQDMTYVLFLNICFIYQWCTV